VWRPEERVFYAELNKVSRSPPNGRCLGFLQTLNTVNVSYKTVMSVAGRNTQLTVL
jgi:hypothetical protein